MSLSNGFQIYPDLDMVPDMGIDGDVPFLGGVGCLRLDVPLLLLEAVECARPDDDIGGGVHRRGEYS